MKALREIMSQAREQAEVIRQASTAGERPTSLYSAGSTGDAVRTIRRTEPLDSTAPPPRAREFTVERASRDVERVPNRIREFTVEPMPTDVENRSRRARTRTSRVSPGHRTGIAADLRSPAALRRAIVLREVLGPPVSLRDPREDER